MPTISMPFPEPTKVVFAGDWHGNINAAVGTILSAEKRGADLVFQVGDFGFWPGARGAQFLDAVSHAAQRSGVPVLWIDGNHEAFPELYLLPVDPVSGLRFVRPNLWHVPRGSRWTWSGLRFAALGGATSLDRPARVEGQSWWPEEAITMREAYETADEGPCDVFITHDCPEGVPIPGIDRLSSLKYWPENELRIAWDHREQLARVADVLQPAVIVHGHFHIRHDTVVTTFGGHTRVIGLAEDGTGAANRWGVTLPDLVETVAQLRVKS